MAQYGRHATQVVADPRLLPEAPKLAMHPAVCPLCGHDRPRRLFDDRNRRENLSVRSGYVECQDCRMIYLSPAPDWAHLRRFYEWLYTTRSGEMPDSREVPPGDRSGWLAGAIKTLRLLRFRPHSWPADAGRDRRLMEVGCSDAVKLMEFAQRGWKVMGVDISASALARARQVLPSGEFYQGELEQLDLPERAFHVVRADNVLEHVPNPSSVVTQCARLLIPGEGRLIIYVPHGRSLSMRLLGRYSNNSWIPFHLSLFTRPTLRRMLIEAGFKHVDIWSYTPMHALPFTLRQALGRRGDERSWRRLRWPLYVALFPVGWLADRLGIGEELIAVARM